jgi:uncharacterized membrane protein
LAEKRVGPDALPDHIEATVQSIAEVHKRHDEEATPQQRLINHLTILTAQPWIAGAWLFIVVAWIGFKGLAPHTGLTPFDPAPFSLLQAVASVTSLFLVVLVLGTQRHEDELSRHRELLTLELAILSEQKAAKIIQLLEESRRDNPLVHNRVDPQADSMSNPADPRTVIDAIRAKAGPSSDPSAPV